MTLRKRLYLTLEPTEKGGILERIFEVLLILIILLNITVIVLESVKDLDDQYHEWFAGVEMFSIYFFTLEYIARLYAIVENPEYSHPIKGRLKYVKSPLAIIDLFAFLPFYLSFITDLRVLRIFRLMALFRMFKIARYLQALQIFQRVLRDRKEQLVLSFIFILFVLVIISFAMFYIENEAQPDKFSSIPDAMWWGVATLTTIGYGDIVPITSLGKFFGGVFGIAGVGLLALPAGILSSGFFEMLHTKENSARKCPHCGGEFHDEN